MKPTTSLLVVLAAVAVSGWVTALARATPNDVIVRIAELEIDPAQLSAYTEAVRHEMEDAVRLEAGVLAIYAVAEKDNPTKLHFFEIYTTEAAYASHRESPHFKKYLAVTQPMIRNRKLVEAVPIQMSDKVRR